MGTPYILTTTVTTGVISSATAVTGETLVTNWSTRFQAVFDEYRVMSTRFIIKSLVASTGVTRFFFDSNGTAALIDAQERRGSTLVNTNASTKSSYTMTYTPKEPGELAFVLTYLATTGTYPYFCAYTNAANFGATAVATPLWLIQPELVVEFRGLKST
jgi:hypothetical protein